MLSFDFLRQVESFNGAFDQTEVQVVTADGTATTVFSLDSSNPSTPAWGSSGNISLEAFAGQEIQLRFRFMTVDSSFNNFIGWLIDDVSVD